ncbi:hypothetical protein [Hominisplanchenecus sp.]|jgi:hypothetical protein|uniref:hypothetical protein n=1 Tax=Hominisplanchenecus sp. TaxID=3038130 RepID=UPI003993E03F
MTDITEILKKILTSVYGRDVRQSIHDGILDCHNDIEACKSYTDEHVKEVETKMAGITGRCEALLLKTRKDVRNVQAIFSVEKTVSITDGKLWEAQDAGSSCVLMEGAKTQCTTLNIQRGERYIIHTSMVSRSSSGRGKYPIIFAVDNSSAGFTMVSAVEIEEEGDCDYIVTVPDNAKYMMISANENGEGIWVRRINVLTE